MRKTFPLALAGMTAVGLTAARLEADGIAWVAMAAIGLAFAARLRPRLTDVVSFRRPIEGADLRAVATGLLLGAAWLLVVAAGLQVIQALMGTASLIDSFATQKAAYVLLAAAGLGFAPGGAWLLTADAGAVPPYNRIAVGVISGAATVLFAFVVFEVLLGVVFSSLQGRAERDIGDLAVTPGVLIMAVWSASIWQRAMYPSEGAFTLDGSFKYGARGGRVGCAMLLLIAASLGCRAIFRSDVGPATGGLYLALISGSWIWAFASERLPWVGSGRWQPLAVLMLAVGVSITMIPPFFVLSTERGWDELIALFMAPFVILTVFGVSTIGIKARRPITTLK